ncbi:MAG: hypothetical protein IKO26_04520 [Paludibacteraceae bacterium]|nr:hypothetical protein [Paludibacteraceae bacterium]
MKLLSNTKSRWLQGCGALLILCALWFTPQGAYANDYLEKEDHYKAYPTGVDRVHFVLPVWAYGKSYDFYIHESSTIWYQKKGSDTKTTFANFCSDPYDENEKDSDKGTAHVKLLNGMGDIIVTSMANGVNHHIHDNGTMSDKLIVVQKEADGNDHVTFLELDWYPPISLEKDTFSVGITVSIRWSKSKNEWYNYSWTLARNLTCKTNTISPQLYTPYLYTFNEKGVAGYGYAAVPYMVFQDPVSYYISFNPAEVVSRDVERSGTIYIPTTDTVQKNLTATFTVVRNADTKSTMEVTTPTVDILPYHRIYNFSVREETDSTGTFTGNNILSWNIKNPKLQDLLENDYFEIHRSLESDFSDAERINVVQMLRDSIGMYSLIDNNRSTWTGNAAIQEYESKRNFVYTLPDTYMIYDENGEPIYELSLSLSTDKIKIPCVPVYYRIRRASSSIWGWEREFSQEATLTNINFLAPLAETQEMYEKDPDYESNRKVNFKFKIENKYATTNPFPPASDCKFAYKLVREYDDIDRNIVLKIDYTQYMGVVTGHSSVFATIYSSNGTKIVDNESITTPKEYSIPKNSTLTLSYNTEYENVVKTYVLNKNSKIWFNTKGYSAYMSGWFYITSANIESYTPEVIEKYMTQELQDYLKDSLRNLANSYYTGTEYGRCMWDRTAQLVLRRTIEETGQTMEFIIPQDSIRRQADGSWIATYSDIANQGCSHYKYSIRIDQTRSDLHVQDSASLRPIEISGPSLYFDEAATITNFEATQGDATTAMKAGVLLHWQASSNAVNEYILLRKAVGSDEAADTIYRGIDNSYLDRSAMPNTHYEYTIQTQYVCNGKSTGNYATAEGWRTPYGEISGTILMPDNTGMAGVTVALQDGSGNTIRTMTTNASGAYKFDSLEYVATECEKAKVKITYSYNFSIYAPEKQTQFRVLDANGNVLEDWNSKDEGTYEYAEGTVLQVQSIFPDISGGISTFAVSGHFSVDCNYQRTKSGSNYNYSFKVTATEPTSCQCTNTEQSSYVVVPTHQYGTFSFNSSSAGTASIALSTNNAVASGIDFMNTSSTRLTGRVLYKNSTIPVAGAMFLLNGDTVRRGNTPLTSGIDGNFELILPLHQPCRLQVFKPGHVFEGDGILRVEDGEEEFALAKALDGVRFYDQTKVRLVGRVAGGNDQRDLPRGFGLGTNNLGDDLQLVLQLEGDNTAQLVHDPDDLSRDTIQQTISHIVYLTDSLAVNKERIVGTTHTLFEKKRITIHPDSETGEFEVDLFPVKYKVIQATATGYATLFGAGQGSETFDLTNAPLTEYIGKCNKTAETITVVQKSNDEQFVSNYPYTGGIASQGGLLDGDSIHYNAVYDCIYHSPVVVTLKQVLYGLDKAGYGEEEMEVSSLNLQDKQKVSLYEKQSDGSVTYLLGHPVFIANRKYQFIAEAFERYYYNNDPQSGVLDEVPQRGGSVRVHNGLKSATTYQDYTLDSKGQNKSVILEVEDIDTENSGESALRTVSTALQVEGNYVETEVFQAFVSGTDIQNGNLTSADSEVVLLDIVRDPGGNGSSAWVESGTTYNYTYTETYDWKIGLELTPKYGVSISQDIGAVAAPEGAGSYIGSTYESSRQLSFTLPITHEWKWGYKYNYTFTTTDRISTSSSKAKDNVSSNGDVFLGTTIRQLAGKAKTVSIISDSMFIARQPAFNAGLMKILSQGTDSNGKHYYLVTGQKVVLGSLVAGTFVYTQYYILNTLIPQLALERQNLLMNFDSEEAAQAYADQTGEPVYWYYSSDDKVSLIDSLPYNTYKMLTPTNSDHAYINRVAALDNMITQWVTILYQNEKEKVMARMAGSEVGTWSVSSGATITHTDTYNASAQYNEMPQGGDLVGSYWSSNSAKAGQKLLKDMTSIVKFFMTKGNETIGKTVLQALNGIARPEGQGVGADPTDREEQQSLGTKTNSSSFSLDYNPIFSYDNNMNSAQEQTVKKTSGFTLGADSHGDITVSVYRAPYDSVWDTRTEFIRENVGEADNDDLHYGSYVFYTVAGSTYCPHEAEEKTQFYNEGTILNNETQWVDKPEISIDTYEQTGVQPDKRATFRVTLMDNGQVQTGLGASGTLFNFALWADSNPDGAKVYVDGAPLINAIPVFLVPGQAVVKTVEVERGTVDDYNNLTLALSLADCPKTNTTLKFSVHFLPVSSDVSISMPRQNWIMNTLSAHDSVGYYLPVEIDEFDIHHKNFDHIEFQYKLSTQSEDDWVNQCSFYASDSLYQFATGNKAMIRNGRIEPFRFYGERDPMEQQYDLRAVSFCRYGSGFVTKSSPVISGTKDTRPPRVFGEPEPVNAILGVGDNLKLRFNEPIAGNYLDPDNNFQIKGVTNATGITTAASVHFDGTAESYAISQVSRSLSGRSFTLDMLVKPTAANREHTFFEHGTDGTGVRFGLTADNRLMVGFGTLQIYSKPLDTMLDFTRVCVTYNNETNEIRFFAGTMDMADPNAAKLPAGTTYDVSAPLVFGRGLDGNMLELRLWSKALTQEEVAATNMHYLTGYELELVAYYQMAEGHGTQLTDKAGGATLTLHGATWNLPKGISLAINSGERVQLNGNLLGRSKVYDETLMLWFRPTSNTGDIFSAGRANDSIGTLLTLVDGNLVLHSDQLITSVGQIKDNEWHHFALSVNRTYNNVSVFLDGKMTATFAAIELAGITGAMYFGGNGFEGNIDEFAIFEQALPKTLIEEFGNHSPVGDEMGLIAYLPFEEQKLNANNVIELVFSPNDQHIYKDINGNVVKKIVPLILTNDQSPITNLADKTNYAPVAGNALLSNLNFDWAFNQDELLINLLMQDREINKQTIYVTVRDVEDLNGNPMPSPVTWVAYVDRNSLTWDSRTMELWQTYGSEFDNYNYRDMRIVNNSGKRHQFTIESLPDWLTVEQQYGTIQPIEDYTVRFYYDTTLPVGEYTDMVYVTDENGLSEPLKVTYHVTAVCPYEEPDKNRYPFNMSLCGQVLVDDIYDTDSNDKVIAIFRNECVGMTNVNFSNATNTSEVFMTINGSEAMKDKDLNFLLWRASTGKVLNLSTSEKITFVPGNVYGCGADNPIIFTTSGSETQNISLKEGWNWISTHLNMQPQKSLLNSVMSAAEPWKEGDLIKNPTSQQFSTYSETLDEFIGTLKDLDYTQMYMAYVKNANIMRLNGNQLKESEKHIQLRGEGQWNAFPCLLSEATPVMEALADYYDYASPGDLIKGHSSFAVFSSDKRWVGDLTALRPGEGYFFRRVGQGTVTVNFYSKPQTNAPAKRFSLSSGEGRGEVFSNPKASSNMTMIAKVQSDEVQCTKVRVYVGDELAGVAEPITIDQSPMTNGEALYFLTIQSDKVGQPLRFETEDGQWLNVQINEPYGEADRMNGVNKEMANEQMVYAPDAHSGSLKAPVILKQGEPDRVRKVIENDHVVIIRGGERYDVTGKRLNQ